MRPDPGMSPESMEMLYRRVIGWPRRLVRAITHKRNGKKRFK